MVDLFLDSGVFSAWNRKEELSIKDYMKFLTANMDYLWAYVTMDKMPGKFGHRRTQAEVNESAGISYKNQQTMKKAGFSPIPVFHQGESFDWLKRYLDDGEEYIGVSTSKEAGTADQSAWLDKVYTYLTDEYGRPLVKTHGFGITKPSLIFRFPFFSCDSTTWTLSPGFGQILVPPLDAGGEFDYNKPPVQVILTSRDRELASDAKAYEFLSPAMQGTVLRFLEEAGTNLEYARYHPDSRRLCTLLYYTQLMKRHKVEPFQHRGGSFERIAWTYKPEKLPKWDMLHIMLATNLSKVWGVLMNDIGARWRLLNYFELRDKGPEVLKEYVTTGTMSGHRPKSPKQDWGEHYSTHRRLKLLKRMEDYRGPEATD